jgi:hypothetical protein
MSGNNNSNNSSSDLRRYDKIKRYKASMSLQFGDDQLQEYMNVVGMIFSMCGLMMKVNQMKNIIFIIYFNHNIFLD